WHSFAKHTEVNTSDLISNMTESLRIVAESFTKKNENKDQQYNGNVHRTQTSETPNTPQQSTLNTYGCNTIAAFDDPPSYEEAMKTKKCELGDGVNVTYKGTWKNEASNAMSKVVDTDEEHITCYPFQEAIDTDEEHILRQRDFADFALQGL
ncbi:uncharacterized protein LOC132743005, partial [Ruditapes philippinarum]|uniref:uncharacterized protein LOC132743005 n=1 Tax=Ruditapes philippinarum TaxID=129788 RepID=UPI00295A7378